jgi:hypothetical protein
MKKLQQPGASPQRVRHRQVQLRRKVHETVSDSNTGYRGIVSG